MRVPSMNLSLLQIGTVVFNTLFAVQYAWLHDAVWLGITLVPSVVVSIGLGVQVICLAKTLNRVDAERRRAVQRKIVAETEYLTEVLKR